MHERIIINVWFFWPFVSSSLPTSTLIRILRMEDPERGQKTLNFSRTNEEDEEDDEE